MQWILILLLLLVAVDVVFSILSYFKQDSDVSTLQNTITSGAETIKTHTLETAQSNLVEVNSQISKMTEATRKDLKRHSFAVEKSLIGVEDTYYTVDDEYDPTVNYQPFAQACTQSSTDDSKFAVFRKDEVVVDMLEHVSLAQARLCCELVEYFAEEHKITIPWEEIQKNDQVGSPTTFDYSNAAGDVIALCPTTARYILYAMRALQRIRLSYGSEPCNIIEIGGGYGGQCSIFHKLSSQYGVNIQSYTILDLPEPGALQLRFLRTQLTADQFSSITACTVFEPNLRDKLAVNSFLFSAYAYSEISTQAQTPYNAMLAGFVNHGLIVWNNRISPGKAFFNLIAKNASQVIIMPEKPQTAPFNFIYMF